MASRQLHVWAIAAGIALASATASSQAPALRVVSAGPLGELLQLADADDVRIVFSEPMIDLGVVSSGTAPSWVHVTPAVPGTFYWSGTRTLMFSPDATTPIPNATAFTVRVDGTATSSFGRALGAPYEFKFTTPTVRLLGVEWYRKDGRFDQAAVVRLRFNQPVRPEDVLAHTNVTFASHDWGAPPLSESAREYLRQHDRPGLEQFDEKVATVRRNTLRSDPVAVRVAASWDETRFPRSPATVVLETVDPPPTDAWLKFQLDDSLPSPAGPVTAPAQESTAQLEPTFFVAGVSCTGACNPAGYNSLQLTRTVRLGALRQSVQVADVVDPARELPVRPERDLDEGAATRQTSGSVLEGLGFDLQPPMRRRRVSLSPTLTADDGQRLGYPWTAFIETTHHQAGISVAGSVWEARLGTELPNASLNVTSRTTWLASVLPVDIVSRLRALDTRAPSAGPPEIFRGGPSETHSLTITPDTWGSHPIDLRRLLSAGGTGIVAATVGPAELLGDSFAVPRAPLRPRSALVQVTNLGISVKDSRYSTLVFVTALDTGQAVAGASVAIVDRRNTTRWTGVTGADGVALAPAMKLRPEGGPGSEFVVTARKGDDLAFVGSNWIETTPWQWGLSYGVPDPGTFSGSVFTDRGAYRETEEVRIKAVIREDTQNGPRAFPAGMAFIVVVEDSRGREVDRRTIRMGRWSSADWAWRVPAHAALGTYTIGVSRVGVPVGPYEPPPRVTGSFLVAAYRKPDFRVDASLSAEPAILGTTLHGTIEAAYLFGARLGDRPVRWWVHRQFGTTVPDAILERYPAEKFDVGYWPSQGERDRTNVSPVDQHDVLRADGRLDVSWPTAADDDLGGTFSLEGDVEDVTGQHISNRAFLTVHPAALYVAISRPSMFVDTRAGITPRFVAVDLSGRPVAGVEVAVSLVREEWVHVPPKPGSLDIDFRPYGTWERRETPAGEWTTRTTATETSLSIPVARAGSYIVRARARDAQGRRTRTDMSFYAIGAGVSSWKAEGRKIDLTPERSTLKPGETARLLVQSPWEHATALLTVEREGIRRHRVFNIQSTQDVVEVPVTAADGPNVYVSVLLVKGRTSTALTDDGEDPGRPDYRLGYAQLTIDDAAKRLRVNVTADKATYRPREPAKVSLLVQGSDGQPASGDVTLWAVDEGVLSLTGYRAPDLVSGFYAPRSVGVSTEDNRVRLIARGLPRMRRDLPGVLGGIASSGLVETSSATVSDAEIQFLPMVTRSAMETVTVTGAPSAEAGTLRTDFRTLAFWLGSATPDANGRVTTTVKLPDSLTTYRILAVAADATRFGMGEHTIQVSKPLNLLPEFPRFLNAGDRASFNAVVSNAGHEAGTATVSIQSLDPGTLEFGTVTSRTIRLVAGASAPVLFEAVARAGGSARVRMVATLGTESDAFEVPLTVNTPLREEITAAYGETAAAQAVEKLALPGGVSRSLGGLTVDLSSTALVGFTESARYLAEYPYECAEQKASRALALLLAADLGDAFQLPGLKPAQYRGEAGRVLRTLTGYQCGSGGFAMWPEGCESESPYLTAYVVHVLQIAKRLKVPVDAHVSDEALDYLEQDLRDSSVVPVSWRQVRAAERAYSVKVLAEAGRTPGPEITRLVATADRMPLFALSYLADALAAMNDRGPRYQDLVRRITNGLRTQADRAHIEEVDDAALSWLWTTNTRATAVVLDGFVRRADAPASIAPLARWLVAERSDGRWRTTHENATALEALVTYYRGIEGEVPAMSASVKVGGATVGTAKFEGRSTRSQQVQLSMANVLKQMTDTTPSALTISRTGTGRLYYTARVRTFAPESPQPVDRGISVERRYERYLPKGRGPATTEFAAGDLVRVVVTLHVRGEGRFLALTDPLPAGFEPIDDWFQTTASDLAQDAGGVSDPSGWLTIWRRGTFDHVEKHDDRVLGFATRLASGRHEFTYLVRATSAGTFTAAGARVEAMYAPEFRGRSGATSVTVK